MCNTNHRSIQSVSLANDVMNIISGLENNIWFVSDVGSDENDCHTEVSPCRNLQTVLDRASDGADIYITSNTLSLDHNKIIHFKEGKNASWFGKEWQCCLLNSSLSFNISSITGTQTKVICEGLFLHESHYLIHETLLHCDPFVLKLSQYLSDDPSCVRQQRCSDLDQLC